MESMGGLGKGTAGEMGLKSGVSRCFENFFIIYFDNTIRHIDSKRYIDISMIDPSLSTVKGFSNGGFSPYCCVYTVV